MFRESGMYVAYEFDIASCGDSSARATVNIQDAVRTLFEFPKERNTLGELLEETGYKHAGDRWIGPEFVFIDRLNISL